ncbi:16S rRNA (guanine(966)-N(2))-methyltransferase RsmD [Anaerosolibacter carboniphilus]|uniref:16S rRNA (Guanine(966)-N(2))-methyltransferase RsmD n=1 Tax=Anaerosolibacter carboniphilus TaxID=1417629 RepID=A0A841KVW6_9FIRM|nr:16S rRNA (guanine(966)-N(2))-methyltransferase RsmD [Anaerosolibacter carboniphilus]MBB6217826.1 16S rRNA (guanine(966)-N(2))-methyltransferase RsmD [Anaerosolibacter carboniphilus]
MRVIAGELRGRKIKAPDGLHTRPTTDRVKESIFSMIYSHLADSIVLDLFAGSGSLGIEALSRGAQKAYFIENNKQSLGIVKENLTILGLLDQSVVLLTDAIRALKEFAIKGEKFDIIFLDPPYMKGFIIPCVEGIEVNGLLNTDGIIVIEHKVEDVLPDEIGNLLKMKDRRYGDTNISIYSREALK